MIGFVSYVRESPLLRRAGCLRAAAASCLLLLLPAGIWANINDDLLKAASQGSVAGIQAAMRKGARIGATDQFGRTALHLAASKGYLEAIETLLSYHSSLASRDSSGLTPLLRAAASLQGAAVKLLLDRGADRQSLALYLSTRDSAGRTLLHIAARDGSPASLEVFCRLVSSVDPLDAQDRSPLSYAAAGAGAETGSRRRDYLQAVQILLVAGADPLRADQKGDSPLWYAVHQDDGELAALLTTNGADIPSIVEAYDRGDRQIARLLIDVIKDPAAADAKGQTYLHAAAQQGLVELAQAVLDRGADVDPVDRFGRTPLSLSAARGYLEIASILLDAGADPDRPAEMGATPLDLAARQGQTAMAELLLSRGADINPRGRTTPLIEAVNARNAEMTGFLLSRGARMDLSDDQGMTPLFYCVEARTGISGLEVLKTLLEQGPTVDIRNTQGETPLLRAVLAGRREEAAALLDRGADPEAADASGRTPVSAARAARDPLMAALFTTAR